MPGRPLSPAPNTYYNRGLQKRDGSCRLSLRFPCCPPLALTIF
nr:MAG TPA: hypothetical protein [Caudoviricetes sp.]